MKTRHYFSTSILFILPNYYNGEVNKVKALLILSLCILTAYSFWFEPSNLEVTHHELQFGNGERLIKIAQLSDLHTTGLGKLEQKVIDKLAVERPDLILITGDIANPNGKTQGYLDVLTKINAPLGVYFVSGNWEVWTPIEKLPEILEKANISNLENRIKNIKDNIWLIGFADELEGSPDLSILDGIPQGAIKVSIFHSPSFFHQVNDIQLSLSGHSHGGQVRLPFIGALWVPDGTDRFVAGWFEKGESKMYVSRGIGTSILPIRFGCRPELAIFRVHY